MLADLATQKAHIARARTLAASACDDAVAGQSLAEDDKSNTKQRHVLNEEGAYKIQ